MSQTITISAPIAMSVVPALMLAGGLIVGLFLRGDLTTAIEAARLNAENDARTARWLFLRGYRKTPHAGPDLTPEPLADRSHADEQADHTDTDRKGMWRVLLGLARDLGLRAWHFPTALGNGFARWMDEVVDDLRDRFKPDEVLDAENRKAADIEERLVEIGQYVAANPPSNPQPYTGRHWVSDVQHTGVFPIVKATGGPVNATPYIAEPPGCIIPKQRDGEVQA